MNIAKKLMLVLVGLVLSQIVLVGVATFSINNLREGLVFSNRNLLPSVIKIDAMARDFAMLRVYALRHILFDDARKMAGVEDKIKTLRVGMDRDFKDYLDNLISDEKDKALLLDEQRKVGSYYAVLDEILRLSREQLPDKAKELLFSAETEALIVAATDAFKTHVEYNIELVTVGGAAIETEAVNSIRSMFVLPLLAAVVALIMGVSLYRQIVGALHVLESTTVEVASQLDFTKTVPLAGRDEVSNVSRAFNGLLGNVRSSLQGMAEHANRLNAMSSELAAAAQQVSMGSESQSQSSAGVAAAVEQLTVSINHVSDRASQASQLALEAGTVARNGSRVINQTLTDITRIEDAVKEAANTVMRLNEGSAKVNNVVTVIREVAEQTNLLALNAAIEAARAGEQGRGFAVVADEVRKLAERTSLSTQEIATTIIGMQSDATEAVHGISQAVEQVAKGVEHTQEAEKAVREIEAGAEQTVKVVGEIADAIREQSTASSLIAQEIESLAQMIEENSAAACSAASSASALKDVSDQVQREVARYQV